MVNCYAPKFIDLISFENERSIFLRFPVKRNDAESETIYFESLTKWLFFDDCIVY